MIAWNFGQATAANSDLGDGAFDAVVAHTLLSQVDDPLAVVREAARLVRSGGIIGIFDGDYASMTFGHADAAKGKAYDEAIISGVVTSPRVMRQMPRLLQAAGLQLVTSFPYILAEVGKADFWAPAIESFRRLVPKSGAMTEQEANAWAESLCGDSAAGGLLRRQQLLRLRRAAAIVLKSLAVHHNGPFAVFAIFLDDRNTSPASRIHPL